MKTIIHVSKFNPTKTQNLLYTVVLKKTFGGILMCKTYYVQIWVQKKMFDFHFFFYFLF